jgi:hypothetical protein
LLYLLVILAVLLIAGVTWAWPRLAGAGPRLFGLRVAALCAIQGTLVSLTFVVVNRTNDFYSSWSDLFGRYTGGGLLVASRPGVARQVAAALSVLSASPVAVPGRSQPAGVLESVLIRGQLSGLSLRGQLYLPPGYPSGGKPGGAGPRGVTPRGVTRPGVKQGGARRQAGRASPRYPVIVAISAALSSPTSPYGARRLAAAAASQIVTGRLRPLIVVMLRPGPGADLGCLNEPGGIQAAMFFAQDLPAAIGASYLADRQRSGWGLLADASGGYCALQLALTQAPVFAAAAVPAGSYQAPPGRADWGRGAAFRAQDNLQWLVRHQPMQPIAVLFTGPGQAGPFLSWARRPMRVAALQRAPAAAKARTAAPWPLAQALDWLGRTLSAGKVSAGKVSAGKVSAGKG